jgi:hypothetical protein
MCLPTPGFRDPLKFQSVNYGGYIMKIDRRKLSGYLLILGMVFLSIGITTKNTAFSWAAVACLMISLVMGGKWINPGGKK